MRIRYWLVLAFVLFSPLASYAQTPQLAGVGANPTAGNGTNGSDTTKVSEPSIIPRFDGSVLAGYHYWPYDSVPVVLGPIAGAAAATKNVVGAHTLLIYGTPDNTPSIAFEQYYEAQIQKAGGGIAYSCDNDSCGAGGTSEACLALVNNYYPAQEENVVTDYNSNDVDIADNFGQVTLTECHYFVGYIPASGSDGDIYVSVIVFTNSAGWGGVDSHIGLLVNVVEASNFAVKTVHLDADKMASDITATGKVDIYGIYFDTDQYVIKPASQDALQQIAKLLTNEPTLHVLIVGHTDSQGDYDHNITLSQNRANAVVQALVKTYHIDPSRLKPVGDGMTAPVATNDTDAGRALNRRVELVKD